VLFQYIFTILLTQYFNVVYYIGVCNCTIEVKWGGHLQRMGKYCLPRIVWKYEPTGRRNPGRPRPLLSHNRPWGLDHEDDDEEVKTNIFPYVNIFLYFSNKIRF
jgi:hypothetical protein